MKFLSSLYLPFASQLNVGCYMMGSLILGTAFYILSLFSVLTTAMACTATLAASTAAWAIACILVSCLVTIFNLFSILLEVAFVRLPYFSLPIS